MSTYKVLADLHPLVISRITVEWARIDREFPMRRWGEEYLGTHVTLGNDMWIIGRYDKGTEPVLQITLEKGARGGEKSQHNWRVPITELRERGCQAELGRI